MNANEGRQNGIYTGHRLGTTVEQGTKQPGRTVASINVQIRAGLLVWSKDGGGLPLWSF